MVATSSTMPPALNVHEIRKTFGNQEVVRGVNFTLQPGEIFGLLGPNGAGKSTIINMISGVTRLSAGKIEVFGYDNVKAAFHTRSLSGVMHQEIITDPFFDIDRALQIHSGFYGVKDDPAWRNHLIDRLALRPHLKKHMNKLSGGMKRRFMVAKALIHKPKLVILDEPTAGVDVELRKALWAFVREINKTSGTSVLLTTHHLEEAEEMCDRIAIMNHGEIVAIDSTEALMKRWNQKKIRLRVKKPLVQVPTSLNHFQTHLDSTGSLLDFQISTQTATGDVLSAVYASGIEIVDVETQSARLEDVFLSLTSGPSTKVHG